MKQVEITADDRLRVLAIRMLHADSGQWFLTTALRRGKNPANEVMRIARMWKRICEYFTRELTGEPYVGFVQARLMSNDLILGTIIRRMPELTSLPTLPPKEPAAAPPPSPAPTAASAAQSASKRQRAPAGTVTDIAQARIRKPKKG